MGTKPTTASRKLGWGTGAGEEPKLKGSRLWSKARVCEAPLSSAEHGAKLGQADPLFVLYRKGREHAASCLEPA